MSKSKEKDPELIKKLDAAKKAVAKAVSEADSAKEKLEECTAAVKSAVKDEEKTKAETALGSAKEVLRNKLNAVESIRIKNAQNGGYLPEIKERKLFHIKLDKPLFSKTDGKKLSKEYIQKFTEPEWNHFLKNSKSLGFTIEIMWNPALYLV